MAKYFKLSEFVLTPRDEGFYLNQYANLSFEVVSNLLELAESLDKIRFEFGAPIIVTSGFRCDALNTHVKGAKNSFHKKGRAADIKPKKQSLLDLLYDICSKHEHVELIKYDTFIHFAV